MAREGRGWPRPVPTGGASGARSDGPGKAAASVEQAVLLVGGLGTRLRPLTDILPKAMIPVANLPLIAYEIVPLVRAGVRRIIFAMGYKADLLRRGLGDGREWGAEFVYVEEPEPLDTAGAIGNVRQHVDGPFFVCNGDIIYDVDLAAFAGEHVERGALVSFCLRQTKHIEYFGLIQYEDSGRVSAFCEKAHHDETGRNTVNSGFYVMAPEVFDHIPVGSAYSSERQLFPKLLAAGLPLFAHLPENQGYWADVGRLDTYLQASGDVLEGALGWYRPRFGGRIASGATVAPSVSVDAGARVDCGARLGERVAVGADSVVEKGACIANSIIWPGSRVGQGARLTDTVVAGTVVPAGHEATNEVIVG